MGGGRRTIVSDDEQEDQVEDVNVADIDEDDDDENEDEDEEGQDEYEKDGFIVDDVEEEEEEEKNEGKSQKKKKKKKRIRDCEKNFVLDDDDYELLEDNISGFHRPKMASNKFKRLKKAGRDTEKGGFKGLFDDDDDDEEPPKDFAEEEERPNEEEGDICEEDEMADFIVEEEEAELDRAPTRQRKQKKKTLKQLSGVSLAALVEAQDIFGDVDELLELRKQAFTRSGMSNDSGRGRKLEEEYEPSILVQKYLTEKDDQIRQIDLPERMQIYEESTGPPPVDERSLREESFWIHSQLLTIPWVCHKSTEGTDEGQCLLDKIDREHILNFLRLHHVEKYDIPFIALYRKEQCLSLLKDPELEEAKGEDMNKTEGRPRLKWHKVLWAIKNLDIKWLLFQKRKSILLSHYNKRYEEESHRIYDEARLSLNLQLFESITKCIKHADSEREIDDVDLKFNLHFPPGEVVVDEGQYKRPKKKSLYSICSKAGLWEVLGRIGPNSEQFGLQITLEKVSMEVSEDPKESPEEIASNFTCSLFETPEAVLKGARHMAAMEISCEPCVRKHVRSIFMDKAEVSTKPTPAGNTAIDSFHQFAGIKWLQDKPLSKFEDAQWLLIQKAEEEKLLQVTMKLPETILNKLIDESNVFYLSDGVSKSARLWNEQRKLILQDAFSKFLLPSVEKEVYMLLTARAKNWVAMEYGKQLWSKVSIAPYHKGNEVGPANETAPRVMACCWGPGKPETTFVMLDSSGEVLDVLSAGYLSIRSPNVNDQQRKTNDQQQVLKFMTDHQPHVVVLGAVNLYCTRLKADIFEIIFNMVEENPRDVGQEMDGINIVYGDESLPHLYEYSRISSDQLPGQSGIVKRAVALGRFLQNPLAMVATLCNVGREIVSWKLGSLDQFLTSDEKYEMIEQVMVDVTNQVGVDINLAASHDWLFSPLQFVSGLGPRKAISLQRALVKAGAIRNRKELTGHGLSTKRIFINAVGFLRIRSSGLMAFSDDIDLLDDTRIHPESYGLAEFLAKTVYEYYGQGDEDDAEQELAIEYVRNNQGQLNSFNIEQYAQDNEMINKRESLCLIKLELLHGFQDWRRPYVEPTQDEVFYMVSGENEYTLAKGRTVHVSVRRIQLQRAICVLDSGLTGILSKEDYSNEGDDFDLMERLHEGDTLSCKIKNVQRNRFQVFLTCKESWFKRGQYQNWHDVDPYYYEDESKLSSKQDKVPKGKDHTRAQFKPRMIVHPRFQNLTADEAIEFLSDKDVGESVFRPSSRGPSYLSLTLKIYDGVYAHKDITEGGKDHTDITSLLRIGKILKIGDENFEDLDEVMDRYVDPLVAHLKAMISYRKFRIGSKAEVDDLLCVEKSDYPKRIVYCFGLSHEHPGTFILSYIRSTNPHHEYVGLYPKGFKFRKHTFDNIDRLVAYFQKHIDDLQHLSAPSVRSVAAMVPMRSPASKGSAGVSMVSGRMSDNSGWRGQSNLDKNWSMPDCRGINDCMIDDGDGHPSGLPKPYGGREGGSNYGWGDSNSGSEKKDCGNGTALTWGSASRQGGGSDKVWSDFPGAKVQNSPGKDAFPSGWGSNGSGGVGGGNWGGGSFGGLGGSSDGNGGRDSAGGGNWGGGSTGGGNWSGGSTGGGTWGGVSTGGGTWGGGSTGGGTWGGGSTDGGTWGRGCTGGGNWSGGCTGGGNWSGGSTGGGNWSGVGTGGGTWGGGSTGGGTWGGGSTGGGTLGGGNTGGGAWERGSTDSDNWSGGSTGGGNWSGGSTGGGTWGGGSTGGGTLGGGNTGGGTWGRGSTDGGNWGRGGGGGWTASGSDHSGNNSRGGGNWGGVSTCSGNWGGGWTTSGTDQSGNSSRGRGRGGGRGSFHGRDNHSSKDSGFGTISAQGPDSKEAGGGDGWRNFPGAKVQNSPSREAFPGGWGSTGSGNWGFGGGGYGASGDGNAGSGRRGGCRAGGSKQDGRGRGAGSYCGRGGSSTNEERKDLGYATNSKWPKWGSDTNEVGVGSSGSGGWISSGWDDKTGGGNNSGDNWGSSIKRGGDVQGRGGGWAAGVCNDGKGGDGWGDCGSTGNKSAGSGNSNDKDDKKVSGGWAD